MRAQPWRGWVPESRPHHRKNPDSGASSSRHHQRKQRGQRQCQAAAYDALAPPAIPQITAPSGRTPSQPGRIASGGAGLSPHTCAGNFLHAWRDARHARALPACCTQQARHRWRFTACGRPAPMSKSLSTNAAMPPCWCVPACDGAALKQSGIRPPARQARQGGRWLGAQSHWAGWRRGPGIAAAGACAGLCPIWLCGGWLWPDLAAPLAAPSGAWRRMRACLLSWRHNRLRMKNA